VRPHEYAGRRGRIALFDIDEQRFAFVPGGEVSVGYDGSRFVPRPDQQESFAESVTEFGITDDIQEFVDAMTSPPRTVTVPPLLVAVAAVEAGAVAVALDHPRIAELVASHRESFGPLYREQPPGISWHGEARVVLGENWTVEAAWLLDIPSYEAEVDRLAAIGQRLLTPEEWENACGAGAATLFRWGDACPLGRDPHREDHGVHRWPNAFGLEIGQDPYRDERTTDPGVVGGGDGGGMVCGGRGWFMSWLTIATSFRDANYATWLQENQRDVGQMFVRPAILLA
jgi:formylglycine-generating enzyme required for sulfatase activity